MLIHRIHLQGIASGAITFAFRRWRVPTVKAGSTLRTSIGVLAIDAVDAVPEHAITDAMAIAAGYPSRDTLLADLGRRPEGQTYCIRLRVAGPDPRVALREQSALSDDAREQVLRALHRLDRRSKIGPWVTTTLEAIARHAGRRAADLSAVLGQEKDGFKSNVRKLKELGLTESLDVGYRLSRRGEAVLRNLKAAPEES
jgi:hypothetical protein